jgi:glycine oxidase
LQSLSSFTDFLIIGQGLAGSLLAHFLLEEGCSVHVIGDDLEGAATLAAAGIINPVTGRRFVKSWRIDDLVPFARETYPAIGQKLGIDIYREKNILRALFSRGEANDWSARAGEEGYRDYILPEADPEQYRYKTLPPFDFGEVSRSAQIDLTLMIKAYRDFLTERGNFTNGVFDIQDLHLEEDSIVYKNIRAKRIVFCEGYKAKANLYFSYLPFRGDKGEALVVRIPDAGFAKILKHHVFIVPLRDDLYWIGATHEPKFTDALPSAHGKSFLAENLADILLVPFEIVEHRAAVRPTVKDRRPFLGLHPDHPRLAIFNGLGTKGASLGPFWAHHMAGFLLGKHPLDKEVDIGRFE